VRIRIRDGKIRIRDKHPGSATLPVSAWPVANGRMSQFDGRIMMGYFQMEAGPLLHPVRRPVWPGRPGGREVEAVWRQQPRGSLAQEHRRHVIKSALLLFVLFRSRNCAFLNSHHFLYYYLILRLCGKYFLARYLPGLWIRIPRVRMFLGLPDGTDPYLSIIKQKL